MNLADDVPGCTDAEEIGAGGYGRVYRARQPAFDRVVAVKILHGLLDDADTLRRFQRECQAIGAVAGHPNIVGVHDAGGTPSGHPYIVMPYLRRGSLAQRLRREAVPWQQAVQIGIKIAGALHSAHQAGVLHRDIKPENILVSDYGEPQLADFGIAQRLGSIASTATAAAMTPAQGAPELLAGERPSVASDVYGLASSVHTLIRGEPPFARRGEESVFPMFARIATEPPPDLRRHGVPDAVARVLERAMAKAPQDRPVSALAFGQELQAAETSLGLPRTVLPLADMDDVGSAVDAPTRPRLNQPFPPQNWQTPLTPTPSPVTPSAVTPQPVTPQSYPNRTPTPPPVPLPLSRTPNPTPAPPPVQPMQPVRPMPQQPVQQQPPPAYHRTPPPPAARPWAPAPPPQQAGLRLGTTPPPAAPRRRSTRRKAVTVLLALVVVAGGGTAGLVYAHERSSSGSSGALGTSERIQRALLTTSDLGAGDWQVAGTDPVGDQAFCNKPLQIGTQDRAVTTMVRADPPAVVSQQGARRAKGVPASLLGSVRSSAQGCSTWTATEDGAEVTYTLKAVARPARLGDDSAEYLIQRSGGDSLHVVQVYVAQGELLSVVSFATSAATTPADITYAEGLARAGMARLAQQLSS